uniref:Uncharacterized protein n=1 Tax=viral metagenome TaxID=1070528 RepID=A0A6M3KAF9_9ZZZZ
MAYGEASGTGSDVTGGDPGGGGADWGVGWDTPTGLPSGVYEGGRGKTGVSSIGYEQQEAQYEKWGKILGLLFGMFVPIPGATILGAHLGKIAGRSMSRATLSQEMSKSTGMPKDQVDRIIDAGITSGMLNIEGGGSDQVIMVNQNILGDQGNYGNWWEQHTGPVSTGMGPGRRLSGSTWVQAENGRQYLLTPEMLSPMYAGPITWEGGKRTMPGDPDDPRKSGSGGGSGGGSGSVYSGVTDPQTGYVYPANTMSSSRMADPKKDTWNNFLDTYFGITPEGDDPGVPSYLDRVLRDVSFKQDEGKEFLDRLNQISQETVSGLQPYSDMLKSRVEGTKPIGLSFGGKPVADFVSRPDREMGKSYADIIQTIAQTQKDPANARFAMADMMSPEKGYMDYTKSYEDIIKLVLQKAATEEGLSIQQQQANKGETEFSWMQTAKDIIGLGRSGYDLWKVLFPDKSTGITSILNTPFMSI